MSRPHLYSAQTHPIKGDYRAAKDTRGRKQKQNGVAQKSTSILQE